MGISWRLLTLCFIVLVCAGATGSVVSSTAEGGPKIVSAQPLDPNGAIGARPYEMVLAGREPERHPTVSFDNLEGWTLELDSGAVGNLITSRKQQLWDSPVAELAYRGESEKSSLTLRPVAPISLLSSITAASIWIHGNNWSWVPDPTTPQVTISLLLKDTSQEIHALEMTKVRWKEWWLVHKVLPPEMLETSPLQFVGIRVVGAANEENREIFFEDLAFYREEFRELSFGSSPKRGIDLFKGQSPGANTGPGRLPFPIRDTTILPDNQESDFSSTLLHTEKGSRFRFLYKGRDGVLEYCLEPGGEYWGPVIVKLNSIPVATALVDAGPNFSEPLEGLRLLRAWSDGDVARAEWSGLHEGEDVTVESSIRLWQKSLVVDFSCRGGHATGLSYGRLTKVREPELIKIPFLNYGSHHLNVLMGQGPKPFFASVWMDWYLSNASEPYATDEIKEDAVSLNGGVRYLPKTDGERNDLFERFFVTFSPLFEETLPDIPNPPAKEGKKAGSRLWQETWGPKNYEEEMKRSRRLRAYGIEMLTQCNHEIAWRDGGESFTFRTIASPGKGGDKALQEYVEAQKSLGWRSGLYTNYTDYAPVNSNWDIDMVMRRPSGDLVTAWPRCYSPKALFAVEMDRRLAPQVRRKFGSNAAYTDVHTAVSPWDRTDYDARVPGAGTFAATFYAYGELLLHDQEVYDHHCWSEGHHQWLYAGLATGNYGLTYSELKYREYPLLPHFDLLKMHPLSVDIGIPWTGRFFRDAEGWDSKANIKRSIDHFLATTIAYGHMGWLVEETHGIRQTCRSYYMMQQLQSRFAMEEPEAILYGSDSGLITSSEALLNGVWRDSKLYTRYSNGLEVWVNGNTSVDWTVENGGKEFVLPPFGWFALHGDDFFEGSVSVEDARSDFVASPAYIFLDGRGILRKFSGISTSGSVAVRPPESGTGLLISAIEDVGELTITEPAGQFGWDDVRTHISRVATASGITVSKSDVDGKVLGTAEVTRIDSGWVIQTQPEAVRYDIEITDW